MPDIPAAGAEPAADAQAAVTTLYERFPYPERDPEDERRRIIGTWLDDLDILNHHCFRGARDFAAPFRVLVAGGGTGDGTIFLAHQLRETGAEIVHLDVSAQSIEIARRRAAVHGLANIRWIRSSLLDVPALDLGTFDYINCVGVLHHLADPEAGLDALLSALADDGAMAILLYAGVGRTGVYQLQTLLRMVNRGVADDARMIAHARSVLAMLPPTHWFRRGEDLHSDHRDGGDAGVFDLLMHPRDRAYTVPEIYAWFEDRCRLTIEFSDVHRGRLPYDVADCFEGADPSWQALLRSLPERLRHAIAELARGDLIKHSFYATRHANTKAPYRDPDYIPLFPSETHQPKGDDFVRIIAAHGDRPFLLTHTQSGLRRTLDPGRHVKAIFAHLDGRRSFGEIFARVRDGLAASPSLPDDGTLFDEFEPWYRALESIERLQLRRKRSGG